MDIRDAGTSKHGDIRSSSVVILPSGDALEGAVVPVGDGICDEKLRSQNLRRTTGLRAAHRSVLPPRRPNIVYVCYNASATAQQKADFNDNCDRPQAYGILSCPPRPIMYSVQTVQTQSAARPDQAFTTSERNPTTQEDDDIHTFGLLESSSTTAHRPRCRLFSEPCEISEELASRWAILRPKQLRQ
jgi:hypothetical protein